MHLFLDVLLCFAKPTSPNMSAHTPRQTICHIYQIVRPASYPSTCVYRATQKKATTTTKKHERYSVATRMLWTLYTSMALPIPIYDKTVSFLVHLPRPQKTCDANPRIGHGTWISFSYLHTLAMSRVCIGNVYTFARISRRLPSLAVQLLQRIRNRTNQPATTH